MDQVKNMESVLKECNTTVTLRFKENIMTSQLSNYLFMIQIIALLVLFVVVGIAFQIGFRLSEIEKHISASRSQKHTSLLPIKENIV